VCDTKFHPQNPSSGGKNENESKRKDSGKVALQWRGSLRGQTCIVRNGPIVVEKSDLFHFLNLRIANIARAFARLAISKCIYLFEISTEIAKINFLTKSP